MGGNWVSTAVIDMLSRASLHKHGLPHETRWRSLIVGITIGEALRANPHDSNGKSRVAALPYISCVLLQTAAIGYNKSKSRGHNRSSPS